MPCRRNFPELAALEEYGSVTQKGEEASGELLARGAAWCDRTRRECDFDRAGRLISEKKVVPDGSVLVTQWAYDANGNRVQEVKANGEVIAASSDDQDRLLTYGDLTFTHTHHGELFSKCQGTACREFTYDVFGNLRQVVLDNGQVIEYLVDGRNRRIGKKIDGALVQGWLYDDQLRILAEVDGQSNVVARFIYAEGINLPELMEKSGRTYRLIKDQLGSVRLAVDVEDGSIMQEMRYDAWGNVIFDSNPGFQPFGFAGGLYDPQTRLVRFGARDYDASVGRWLSKDPLLFWGGSANVFGYAEGDPLGCGDPRGLDGRVNCERFAYYTLKCYEKAPECAKAYRERQKNCSTGEMSDECIEKWDEWKSSAPLKCLQIPECQKMIKYGMKCSVWPPVGSWPPEVPGGPNPTPRPYRPPKGSGYPPPPRP